MFALPSKLGGCVPNVWSTKQAWWLCSRCLVCQASLVAVFQMFGLPSKLGGCVLHVCSTKQAWWLCSTCLLYQASLVAVFHMFGLPSKLGGCVPHVLQTDFVSIPVRELAQERPFHTRFRRVHLCRATLFSNLDLLHQRLGRCSCAVQL